MDVDTEMNNPLDKLLQSYKKQNRLYLAISAAGLIIFVLTVITLPFHNKLLALLFPKMFSLAAGPNDWAQVGKDPQRTGYSAESLGTDFKVKWTYAFQPERVHPAVVAIVYDDGTGSKVFVGTENGNMYAIDAVSGGKRWSYAAGSPILSSVATDNGKVYFGAMDGTVYGLNSVDGTLAWKVSLSNKGFSASPLLADGKLMLGGRDGKFYALYPGSGTKLWEYNAGSPILQTAAWNNGKAFFGTMDVNMHAVSTSNGAQVWKTALSVAAIKDYWPVVTQGKVIIEAYVKAPYQAGVRPGLPFGWYAGGKIPGTNLTDWQWLAVNGPTIATGSATLVPDFMKAQDNVITAYQSNPNSYKDLKGLYILDEGSGAESFTVPSFESQSLGGTVAAPCVDKDGKLIVPVEFVRSGWGRLDLSLGRIVDVLYDGIATTGKPVDSNNVVPKGMGNRDESLASTCSANLIFSMHLEEGNANYTGAFDLTSRKWVGIGAGYKNRQMSSNNQHATGPATISNGMVYHLAWDELIARTTGTAPTPVVATTVATTTPSAKLTPTPTPSPSPILTPPPSATSSATPTPTLIPLPSATSSALPIGIGTSPP